MLCVGFGRASPVFARTVELKQTGDDDERCEFLGFRERQKLAAKAKSTHRTQGKQKCLRIIIRKLFASDACVAFGWKRPLRCRS